MGLDLSAMRAFRLALVVLLASCVDVHVPAPDGHDACAERPTFEEWIMSISPRVLCVGDSITEGTDSDGGYRAKLHDRVAGLVFVGPYTTENRIGLPLAHAGKSGERADEIEATAASESWMATYTPDIVFVQVGTNDLIQGADASTTASRIDSLAGALADARPSAKIVILAVPFGTYSGSASIATVNGALPAIARAHRVAGRDVVYYDAGNFLVAGDMAESTHPNTTGYGKLADEVEKVMRSIYRDSTL